MKKSFFERLYLTVLVIFLLFFNGGVLVLAIHTHSDTVSAAEEVCLSDHRYIARAFEGDHTEKTDAGSYLLMVSYGSFYSGKDIGLCFARSSDGKVLYSDLEGALPCPPAGNLVNLRVEGTRYVVVSDRICGGEYLLISAKDVSYLDKSLASLAVTFALISVTASLLLALLLYFVMKKMFLPLERLRDTTKEISGGKLESRADERGEDEFAALAKDLNAMADRIGQQMQTLTLNAQQKQQMLDNLAHEMRTPLTSIHGYAEYAYGAQLEPAERMKAMSNIMSESMRLKSISEKLLDSAFIRENGIEKKRLQGDKLLEKTALRFLPKASENGVKITCLPCGLTFVGDEVLMELLLSNLTENAIRACRGKGEVILFGRKEEGEISLCVKDNGIGMTEEQIAHITEPFYRTDKSRSRREGGTGLGLALCKRIADAHGGVLEFDSKAGSGTTASVRLREVKE